MSPPDVPDSDPRSPLIPKRVLPCLPADLEATRSVRERVRPAVAEHGRGYLDRLIHKPWGSEFRVYEDDLADVWCLYLHAGHRTSLHCHPHKRTALLCLEGTGTVSTHGGARYAFGAGDVLHIQPGAYHRAAAPSATGRYRFRLESGRQVRTSTDLAFAIARHPRAMTPVGLTVLGPPCLRTAASEAVYLTIRNQGANACYAQ
jgi:mannose-6-phosphate isomerase-like protein (cupin superfamily)